MHCLYCHWFSYLHLPSASLVGGTAGCGCVRRSPLWLEEGTAVPEEVLGWGCAAGRGAGCPGPHKAVAAGL